MGIVKVPLISVTPEVTIAEPPQLLDSTVSAVMLPKPPSPEALNRFDWRAACLAWSSCLAQSIIGDARAKLASKETAMKDFIFDG